MVITSEQMGINDKDLQELTEVLTRIFNSSVNKTVDLDVKEYVMTILSGYGEDLLAEGNEELARQFYKFSSDSWVYND